MRSSAREIRRGDHTPRRTPPSLQTLLLGRLLGSVGVYGGASTHTRTRRSRLHMLDGEHAAAAASEPRVPTLRKRLPHNAYPRRAVGRPRSGRFRAACPRPGRRPTRASSSFSSSSSRSRPRTWRACADRVSISTRGTREHSCAWALHHLHAVDAAARHHRSDRTPRRASSTASYP